VSDVVSTCRLFDQIEVELVGEARIKDDAKSRLIIVSNYLAG
jgi:hypothetical protein